ncbi:MAG TPA: 2-phospho-L-lactate transferase [Pseudomonadales bacterium]|nr:2-phospho-L-lactate transferase [Pseudomonadales bacterium]
MTVFFDKNTSFHGKVLALCGGVGGAKLAWGLAQTLSPAQLTIVVNTGDDFEHLGLHISPDLDTVMYTLAGINNRELGWGLAGESWQCMQALETLGGETWFRLGDKDIATHLLRTQQLAQGKTLTAVTAQLCAKLGIQHTVLPMSNNAVRTIVNTDAGELAFQDYFVRQQCKPAVRGVRFSGAETSTLSPEILAALNDPELRAVIICPSNPLLSIAPILAVPGMREQLIALREKIIVVSPLVGGQAVKGPTAKMMQEMHIPTDSKSIVDFYTGLLGILVIDACDANDADALRAQGITVQITRTLMKTDEDRIALARALLAKR